LPYGQVIAETDGSGNLVAGYVYGLERISQTRSGNVRFYQADGQGSTRQLTDGSGNITDQYWFTAFGELLAKIGTTENQFLYTGESYDPNCGFYNLRARWYNPTNGRFTSVDPYEGDPQAAMSLHRYLYANASPINTKDPTGLFGLDECMAAIAVSNILCAFSVDASNSRSVRSCIQSFTGQVGWWQGSTRTAIFTLKLNKATNFAMIVQFKKGSIVNLTTGEYQKVDQFGGREVVLCIVLRGLWPPDIKSGSSSAIHGLWLLSRNHSSGVIGHFFINLSIFFLN
jgi:RHS repeat-associated protein